MIDLAPFEGKRRLESLDNGLSVCVLENNQASLVATALCFRAGARDEPAGLDGVAHFLEHMMFKGSAAFGAGEVDRQTQLLGGSNNAFTSHDCTVYHFSFGSDRWLRALDIESDRMRGLVLDPAEIESERRVILEEIAHSEGDPWDALEMRVRDRLFGEHPYGRRILGTRDSLARIGRSELEAFHRDLYRPDRAVLVIAGAVGDEVLGEVEERFSKLRDGAPARSQAPVEPLPSGLQRIEQRKGEVSRMLLALPAAGARDEEDFAALRICLAILGAGRASRFYRRLVDEENLCVSVTSDLHETLEGGAAIIALELLPGCDPQEVEEKILQGLEELARGGLESAELDRARQILLADWVFGRERIHQQAVTEAISLALFDPGFVQRHLRNLAECGPERILEAAARYLGRPHRGVIGWSLPGGERAG